MKKIILFILLVLSIGANAQKYVPFPTENAQWNVFYTLSLSFAAPTDITLLQYSLQGDTTMNNGTVYRKMCRNIGTIANPIYKSVGGLREQDKRIYYYSGYGYTTNSGLFIDGSEKLLYDFNKNIGESVFYETNQLNYTIDAIDSIKIGSEFRKRYKTHRYDTSVYEYIIEGIGNIQSGLFGIITTITTCEECYQNWEFVCFSQNGESVYKNPDYVDCDSTKKWSEVKYLSDDACWTYAVSSSKYQTYLNGDTLIAGIKYKKVYNRLPGNATSSNSCPYVLSGYSGAIREENGKIFANTDNQDNQSGEYLLYDFTAKVGDTIPCKYGYPYAYIVVNKIDTVTLLNGEKRKRFIFPFNSWIEGIGSTFMLLRPAGDATTCMESSNLVCFKQNNISLYYNSCLSGNCCDILDAIVEIRKDKSHVDLNPNPIINTSMLKWDSAEAFSTLTITDLLGKTVKTIDIRGKSEIIINRSDFNKGLYVGRLVSGAGSEATVKIIVQ